VFPNHVLRRRALLCGKFWYAQDHIVDAHRLETK
jgi:hypothetical protein